MVSGWRYLKMGQCADCSEAGARLYVPETDTPHFDATCKGCCKKYSLDVICKEHRLPLQVETGACKLCQLPKERRYTSTSR